MRSIEINSRHAIADANPGAAPQLQWLPIAQLVVDDSYQRELKQGNWLAIVRIARAFKWSRFSPVFVAPVEGGAYAIIDGQHRTHAAALCGIKEVPCQIVLMTREEQAASFAAVNGLVTKVTSWQIFKAALTAKEDWAEKLSGIAAQAGCRLMTGNNSHFLKKPGEIYGVSTFRKLVEKFPERHLVAALRLIRRVDGLGTENECWDTAILAPLTSALAQRPHAMQRPDFAKALELFDVFTMAEDVVKKNRERIRRGLPYVKKTDAIETQILEWIDTRFPERISGRAG